MAQIPQDILDQLTDVPMPKVADAGLAGETVEVAGLRLPVLAVQALVVGSGAAGLRAAVELSRRGVQVLIATMAPFGGTSACSGSDKQTLHTCGTSNRGDDFTKLAKALGAGGGMDLDQAYIEAVGSIHTLGGLQYMGLPLPTDRFGAVLRYQTDHDDVGRATSCGPRTSRLMVKVLAEESLRLGIPWLRSCEAVRILTAESGGVRRCAGVLAIDRERGEGLAGLVLIRAEQVVLATGGPGELYRDSVYPRHCYGSLGMAIEAGVEVCNLTESQFGIGTRRTEFPWNLSGTYVQVMPHIYSLDAEGRERHFLADWYRTTRELASNIFRKGYQWPFHATRMLDFGSSVVDLAIFHESQQGRQVLMDFRRNPLPGADGRAFSLDELDPDVRAYLENNEALQGSPIERLQRMNPLAIELYRMHGSDIAREPLPFNVNNQHMNGGVAVDPWMESSLPGLFAVGEVSGTHGVTRPGGAALNAGQVAGVRAAEQIAGRRPAAPAGGLDAGVRGQAEEAVALLRAGLRGGIPAKDLREGIQARMSDHAGFICQVARVPTEAAAAASLRARVLREGVACGRESVAADVFRWRHMALLSDAVFTALAHYVANGGGSRGARAYCATDGGKVPSRRQGPVEDYRFREERPEHRGFKAVLRWDGKGFSLLERPLRGMEDPARIFFEKNWGAYLTGAFRGAGFSHG